MSSLLAHAKAKREEKKRASDQEKQNKQDEKDEIEREKQAASFRAHWQWSLCQFDDDMPKEATALGVPRKDFNELMNVINGDLLQAYAKKWQDPGAAQNAAKSVAKSVAKDVAKEVTKDVVKFFLPVGLDLVLNVADTGLSKVKEEARKQVFERDCVPALDSFLETVTQQSGGKIRCVFRHIYLTLDESNKLKSWRLKEKDDVTLAKASAMVDGINNEKAEQAMDKVKSLREKSIEKIEIQKAKMQGKMEATKAKMESKLNPDQMKQLENVASTQTPVLLFFVVN